MAKDILHDVLTEQERNHATKAEMAALRVCQRTAARIDNRMAALAEEGKQAVKERAALLTTIRARIPAPSPTSPAE